MSRVGMSYSEMVIGMYFYKYQWLDIMERIWHRFFKRGSGIVVLSFAAFLIIIVRRYVATLFIAPFSGLIFMISFLFARREFSAFGKPFEFLGEHSTNIWLVHMFFYMSRFGGLAYKMKYPVFVLITTLLLSISASYIVMLIQKKLSVIKIGPYRRMRT